MGPLGFQLAQVLGWALVLALGLALEQPLALVQVPVLGPVLGPVPVLVLLVRTPHPLFTMAQACPQVEPLASGSGSRKGALSPLPMRSTMPGFAVSTKRVPFNGSMSSRSSLQAR